MKRDTRLIVALDLREAGPAVALAKRLAPHCDAFKVNFPLVLGAGMEVVDLLADHGPVLCDFKVADIPYTNRLVVEEVFRHRATGVVVHGFPGEDSLRACLEAARGDVFVVAAMSHPGAVRFLLPRAEEVARMAVEEGAAGIVAGATRPELLGHLRKVVGDRLILSPGVGPQGGDPVEAIRQGADHLIVGRRIVTSEDPVKEACRLQRAIQAAAGS